MSYKLNDDIVEYTLKAHDSGDAPEDIHGQLLKLGYKRLTLSAVKQCLLQNGRVIEGYGDKNNTPPPGPPTYTEPPIVKPWDAKADNYSYEAFQLGKSVKWTWFHLRGRGYNVTEAEIIASLESKGIQGWGLSE